MYRNYVVKEVRTNKDLYHILEVLKEHRIGPYCQDSNGDVVGIGKDGQWRRYDWSNPGGEVVDVETLLNQGLIIRAYVGKTDKSTKKFDICKELGFKWGSLSKNLGSFLFSRVLNTFYNERYLGGIYYESIFKSQNAWCSRGRSYGD